MSAKLNIVVVTYFAILQKYVLCLHVTMEYFALVQVEEGEGHLNEPIKYLILAKILAFGCLNLAVNVAAVAVHHHYIQELLAVHIAVLVGHNIRMSYFLKETHLRAKRSLRK